MTTDCSAGEGRTET